MSQNYCVHGLRTVGFCRLQRDVCGQVFVSHCFQVAFMTIASGLRATLLAAAIAALLPVSPSPLSAQEQISTPSTTRIIGAPVGHRQPRPADIPPTDKSAADQLEEKLQAELNRKLRICRGC
jgi:hypothetical protein